MKKQKTPLAVTAILAVVGAQAQTQPAPEQPAAQPPAAQTPASPQPTGWQGALKSVTDACKDQMPQICPGLSTDTAMACLQTNMDKLTPACKDAVTNLTKAALSF